MRNTTRTKADLLQILFAISFSITLLIINIIRIFNIPITIDENGYDPLDSYKVLLLDTPGKANDHILHSVIRKFCIEHFSNNIFFYRVDSLVAQALFLLFSYLLCHSLFKNKYWMLLSFCLLNLISPFIFDFWGLSRGYALSLAFMMMSIYYFFNYLNNKKILLISLSLAAAILSVYSNFGYVNYFFSLAAVVCVRYIVFKKTTTKGQMVRELSVLFIATSVLAILITQPLMNVYSNGEQFFLGSNGFLQDTVTTLVSDGLIIVNPTSLLPTHIIIWLVLITTFSGGIYWLYIYFKGHYYKQDPSIEAISGIILYLLLIIPVVSMIAQHILFHINYLTDRAALFFIILFILHLTYWLYYLKAVIPKISVVIFTTIFLLASYNFCSKINLRSTLLWWFDADDLHVINRIANETKNKHHKIKIRVTWFFVPSFNYDFEQKYPGKFYPIADIRDTAGKDTTYDYYYISSPEVTDKLAEKYALDTSFVGGNFLLFKKKED